MKKVIYAISVGGNKIHILHDGAKVYLPPVRPLGKKTSPRSDFDLLGRAIVGNLGFSELQEEVICMKQVKEKTKT